ncbi:MAG: DUF1002 domain-containing protein [Eubacteriales bacterium]|nr:DUF1002 domain-containing protein [Eubacteriales bacterium]
MKRSKLLGALLCAASLALGSVVPSIPVMADGVKVVTLGADLTQEQKNTMLQYFKVNSSEVQILTITNQDEREHLSAYVPLEQIGTRTLSCAYVKPTTSGGIKVRTANLNWVTCNMIATTLSTSGVTNCEVVAACPFQVSGTGALTGIQMAYETASGEVLDSAKKQIATEEMVITGNLAEQVGQDDATVVINQAKMQVISDDVQNADEIYNIVINTANENGVQLTQEQLDSIVSLLEEIAQQQYDYSSMEETLERVNSNVSGEGELEEITQPALDEDSIIADLDESVLGADVIADSTEDPTLAEQTGANATPQAVGSENVDMSQIVTGTDDAVLEETADVGLDGAEAPADAPLQETGGDELVNTDPVMDAGGTEEITDVSQLATDFLTEDARALFDAAKSFCQGEYEGDAEALAQSMGADALQVVTYLDSETASRLSAKVLEKYLEILGNGAASYVPTGEEKYITAELNILEKDLKKIFGVELTEEEKAEEGANVLGDLVNDEDKAAMYKETMRFFEKLYGESYETYEEEMIPDEVSEETALEEEDIPQEALPEESEDEVIME